MKLLAKTRSYYLIFFLVILVAWTIVISLAIRSVIKTGVDQALVSEKTYLSHQLQTYSGLNHFFNSNLLMLQKTDSAVTGINRFSNVMIFNTVEQEKIPYRQLSTVILVQHQRYKLTIRKSLVESDDMFAAILLTELVMLLIAGIGFSVINHKVVARLWKPFYDTLGKARNFNLGSSSSPDFFETDIQEFRELNEVLDKMIRRIHADYHRLKEFTGNASHEIQTPLSIINAKIELLLQEKGLSAHQLQLIQSISKASSRLSRLNQALLLLARIENNQFPKFEQVNISNVLHERLDNLDDYFEMKKITVESRIENEVIITMNSYLTEVLIGNLVNNALRHNIPEGWINVELDKSYFRISNSGSAMEKDPSQYFNRFEKSGNREDSTGLGLAIVKAICDLYSFEISYVNKENEHVITITFQNITS